MTFSPSIVVLILFALTEPLRRPASPLTLPLPLKIDLLSSWWHKEKIKPPICMFWITVISCERLNCALFLSSHGKSIFGVLVCL